MNNNILKRKIALIVILINICSLNIDSQILPNTTWQRWDVFQDDFWYLHFTDSAMYFKLGNENYFLTSYYYENMDSLKIINRPGTTCVDTGEYTFGVSIAQLHFYLVDDSCVDRSSFLTAYGWGKFPLGIKDSDILSMIEITPNPASDKIYIKTNKSMKGITYIIYDQYGRQSLSGKLDGEISSVNIKQLTRGLYFIQIGEKKKQTFKIMKK